jgi:hypothetical protein
MIMKVRRIVTCFGWLLAFVLYCDTALATTLLLPRATGTATDSTGTNTETLTGLNQADVNVLSPAGAYHAQTHAHFHFGLFWHATTHAHRHAAPGTPGSATSVADPASEVLIETDITDPDFDFAVPVGSGPALSSDADVEIEYMMDLSLIDVRILPGVSFLEVRGGGNPLSRFSLAIQGLGIFGVVTYDGVSTPVASGQFASASLIAQDGVVDLSGLSFQVPFSGSDLEFMGLGFVVEGDVADGVVPEPGTLSLLLVGGLLIRSRHRTKKVKR